MLPSGKSVFKTAMAELKARMLDLSALDIRAHVKAAIRDAEAAHLARLSHKLHGKPIRRARAVYRDRSRYTGAMLRAIRAERGCGRPPKVLAARRAKAEAMAAAALISRDAA